MLKIRMKRKMRTWDWLAIAGSLIIMAAFFIPWVEWSSGLFGTTNTITGLDMLINKNGETFTSYSYLGLFPTFVFVTGVAALVYDIVSLFSVSERRNHIDACIILAIGLAFLILFMVFGINLDLFVPTSSERTDYILQSVHGMYGAIISLAGCFAAMLGNTLNALEDTVLPTKEQAVSNESDPSVKTDATECN